MDSSWLHWALFLTVIKLQYVDAVKIGKLRVGRNSISPPAVFDTEETSYGNSDTDKKTFGKPISWCTKCAKKKCGCNPDTKTCMCPKDHMHGGDAAIQGMEEDAKGASVIERNGILNEIGEAKKKNAQQKPPPPQARKPMSKPSILTLVDKEREFKNTEIAGMKKNKTEIMLREEKIRIRKAAEQLEPLDESPAPPPPKPPPLPPDAPPDDGSPPEEPKAPVPQSSQQSFEQSSEQSSEQQSAQQQEQPGPGDQPNTGAPPPPNQPPPGPQDQPPPGPQDQPSPAGNANKNQISQKQSGEQGKESATGSNDDKGSNNNNNGSNGQPGEQPTEQQKGPQKDQQTEKRNTSEKGQEGEKDKKTDKDKKGGQGKTGDSQQSGKGNSPAAPPKKRKEKPLEIKEILCTDQGPRAGYGCQHDHLSVQQVLTVDSPSSA